MVIACVMAIVLSGRIESSMAVPDGSAPEESFSHEENERKRYLRGEYKMILQLLSVLPHGKLSKHIVDQAIDTCVRPTCY